jgi:hypothetical protein
MAAGGLTYGNAADQLCTVVDNGVTFDDPRVMVRANEATKIVMDRMIPVGGYATYDVAANNQTLLLPPQLENCIEHEVLNGATVHDQTDIDQGWYNFISDSLYIDPDQINDNELEDQGFVPDPGDPKILRRQYRYQGLQPNATVRVTGKKRYLPILQNADYMIVQNIPALKRMIQSIERFENNDPDGGKKYEQESFEMLQAETKQALIDPMNHAKRKADYRTDFFTYPEGTFGYVRASLALDVPGACLKSKSNLSWTINMAEKRLMQRGLWKDTIKKIDAEIVGGYLYFPPWVQTVLSADLNGGPQDIRSIHFEYLKNGPGKFSCSHLLADRGDEYFPQSGHTRRKYKLIADSSTVKLISTVCKIRWLPKVPTDRMIIHNYEAIRLMAQSILTEQQGKIPEAKQAEMDAVEILDSELKEFLGGVEHTVHIQTYGFGLGDVGSYWSR